MLPSYLNTYMVTNVANSSSKRALENAVVPIFEIRKWKQKSQEFNQALTPVGDLC